MVKDGQITLTVKKLSTLIHDSVKSAKAVELVYVNDTEPGITRKKTGKNFTYTFGNKRITDEDNIFRIKRLVLPPAWQNVWICANPNGHLQATGVDTLGRKQYKYHPLWNALRNQTKYAQLYAFGKAMPAIRKQIDKDLSLSGLPQQKVLATVVSLMQCTCIRIGNAAYEKLYGSFGLTTMKDKHVKFTGNEVKFSFKGKKGVYHDISLKNKKLSGIVKQCRDIPGQELFQYYNERGERKAIDSGMVNEYIKQISGGTYTAKDFRTWAGTVTALEAFSKIGPADNQTVAKKNIVTALDMVAEQLGNTRTVCKKYYVHPIIIELYTNNTLKKFFNKKMVSKTCVTQGLSGEEQILLTILEKGTKTIKLAA